jgi:hypothetical protein
VIYLFSDGGYEQAGQEEQDSGARPQIQRVLRGVSYAEDPDGTKRVKDMGKQCLCTGDSLRCLHTNRTNTGLCTTKAGTTVETISEDQEHKVGNIFDYDKFS